MKKLILASLLAGSSLFGNMYDLKPIHITKDITCVIGDFNPPKLSNKGFVSNMCYVNMGDSLVVLDAGPTYKFAKEFYYLMQKEYPKLKVSDVVLTNYHDDRIGGAYFFKELGANIIGHSTLNAEIEQYKDKFGRLEMFMSKEFLKGTNIIPATKLVDGGYKIKGSIKTLEILKLSKVSEERSDIAVYSKDDSFLFVGNIVFNGRALNYRKTSDIDGWIEALENIEKLNVKYILAGHGKEFDQNTYKYSLEYLKAMRSGVKKAYEEELEDGDLIKAVDVKKFNTVNHFKQLNYNNINNYVEQLEFAE